jgi:hypothetical protein
VKHVFIVAAVLLCTSGCGEAETNSYFLQTAAHSDDRAPLSLSPSVSEVVPVLGSGWDATAQRFKIDCIGGRIIQVPPDTKSRLAIRSSMTTGDLMKELGGSLSAKAKYVMFGGSMKGSLAQAATESTLSQIWVYSVQVTDRIDKLDPATLKLNLAGRSAIKSSSWREICGDEVVYQAQRGGVFYLIYRLDYDSEEAKQAIEMRANIDTPIADVSGALTSIQSMLSRHSSLTIEAYQFGGDPSRLPAIVTGLNASAEASDAGARTLLECSNMDLSACEAFVRRAIDYASNTTDPSAFPQQIPRSPATMLYETTPWKTFGHGESIRELNTEMLENARNSLADAFDTAMAYKARLDAVAGARWSTPDQVAVAIEKRSATNQFLLQIGRAIEKCYDRLRPPTATEEEYGGMSACRDAAHAVDELKATFLRLPDELSKNPYDLLLLHEWQSLNGATGPDPTVNQVQVGEAHCGTTGDKAICVYPGRLGLTTYIMPERALARWREPKQFEALGYPERGAEPDARGFGSVTTFQYGLLVTTPRRTTHIAKGTFDAWQNAKYINLLADLPPLGEPCSDEVYGPFGGFPFTQVGWSVRFDGGWLYLRDRQWTRIPAGRC